MKRRWVSKAQTTGRLGVWIRRVTGRQSGIWAGNEEKKGARGKGGRE